MASEPALSEFFLVSLPGLEDLVQAEVLEWFPGLECKVIHGGVTVFATVEQGLAMNLVLKIPTRILLRISSFMCRDFPKLYNKVAKIPWQQWIDLASEMQVHATTARSRLKIKKRIEETCLEGWLAQRPKNLKPASASKKATLYVRLADNQCTLSLDASGERLHKRGIREHVGEAPLRETIAAALIQMVGRITALEPGQQVEIVDPMMGSGTFLIEAVLRDRLVAEREFAFAAFKHKPLATPQLQVARPAVASLVGLEIDRKTLNAARTNLAEAQVACAVNLREADVFKTEPLPDSKFSRWTFVNPPYGERLKVPKPLAEYYADLFAACERLARPDRACFVLPAKAVKGKFILPRAWKVLEKRPFLNGGIPVVALVFGRQ